MKTQNIILISLLGLFSTFEVEAQANIGYVYPSGGEQGKSIDVVVGGQNLTDVKGVFVTGTGISGTIIEKMPVDIKAKNLRTKEQDIPQLEEMIKVRINIDKKAELGLHDFRLETENGYSNRIFFDVNELTEFNEIEPNDKPINATTISKLPSVVNGQIMPGERDCFRFSATKGQIIICQTKARALTPYLADAVPGWFFNEDTQWGHASSPVIYGNTVVVQCDRSKDSFIAAYDLKTGNEVWKVRRDEISSWGTPTVYHGKLRDELVTNASRFIRAYNPATGEELWRLAPNSEITVGTPVFNDSLIFVTGGYTPIFPVYAIRPGGKGDISIADSVNSGESVAWRKKRGGTYMPTPIAYQGYLYTLANQGLIICYNAATGEIKYKETIRGGGAFTASPVAADGKIYCTSEENGVFVIKAGPDYELITTNPVGEICMATPAITDGLILIRGQHHLFCIGLRK